MCRLKMSLDVFERSLPAGNNGCDSMRREIGAGLEPTIACADRYKKRMQSRSGKWCVQGLVVFARQCRSSRMTIPYTQSPGCVIGSYRLAHRHSIAPHRLQGIRVSTHPYSALTGINGETIGSGRKRPLEREAKHILTSYG